eukprot:TRINITY_DN1442_c0_g1_i1.p1 TRINITY_DN1442_c0_g1~~TRINITY_DN1442_c0_g1_i1.p1  ORF type:complete len:594 (-),score=201.55 TRINITY_DN1442_c0_g1_i1:77-1858(-)
MAEAEAEAPMIILPSSRPETVTVVPLTGWPKTATVEPAGRPYELILLALHGLTNKPEDSADAKDEKDKSKASPERSKGIDRGDGSRKKREMGKKLADDELQQDHYAVLGLGAAGLRATDEQIRLAYKRMILETHPDKTKDRDDTKFKAVQAAFDVLSDKLKRKTYDSSLPFDDNIPSAKVPVEQFYSVFGPVFEANARWSTASAVPMLGDDSTSYAEVDSFYDFWFNFKSWRDFEVEHDVEQAESRDERRWMEKENERERNKLRRLENQRILNLVERAYRIDPRLKRRKEEEEQEKAREKERRQQEKLEAERRAKEAQVEEKRQKEQAERERKEEERRLKQELEQRQNRIKRILAEIVDSNPIRPKQLADDCVHKDDLHWLCTKLDLDRCNEVIETLTKLGEDYNVEGEAPLPKAAATVAVEFVNTSIIQIEQARNMDRYGKPLAEPEGGKRGKDHWTEQELNDLTRAIVKWPGGTSNRWENIAQFIGTKTPDQVLKKTKELTSQLNTRVAPKKPVEMKQSDATATRILEEGKKKEEEDIWTKAQQQELEAALKQLKDYKEKDKWEKIAALVTGKTKAQCVARYKFLAQMNKK